jgi:hypothetical protein
METPITLVFLTCTVGSSARQQSDLPELETGRPDSKTDHMAGGCFRKWLGWTRDDDVTRLSG